MRPVGSISQALQSALRGIGRATRGLERAAESVAAGIDAGPPDSGRDFASSLAELPLLRMHAAASVAVARTAGAMLDDLLSLVRR